MPRFPFRVRIFSFCDINVKRFLKIVEAIHRGFWLGVLNRNGLDKATELYYLSLKKYQSLNYNKIGLWQWEENALNTYFEECKSILIGACGGGREIVALASMGFQVDGFECSHELVEYSKEILTSEGIDAQVYFAPPNQVPIELNIYDGLIIGWGGYMHIPGRDRRISFLKQIRLHVKDDGPLLLSFFARDKSKQYGRICKVARFVAFLTRNSHPVELGDNINGTFDHCFTKEEIDHELSQAGFEMVYYSAIYSSDETSYPHAVAKAV